MKTYACLGLLIAAMAFSGCSGAFWGGGAAGAAGGAAGYEVNSKVQMDRLNKDLAAGRINQQEYDIRKDQLRRGSVVY